MTRIFTIIVLSAAMTASATARDATYHHRAHVAHAHAHHRERLTLRSAERGPGMDMQTSFGREVSYAAPGWNGVPRAGRSRSRADFEPQIEAMVAQHAAAEGVPLALARRVVARESGGNPRAVSRGNYGLMQIRHGTARAMGYAGSAAGLLDAETNLTYAMKYLAGAYRAAGGNHDRAVALYARGYYYEARRQGWSPYDGGGAYRAYASADGFGAGRFRRAAHHARSERSGVGEQYAWNAPGGAQWGYYGAQFATPCWPYDRPRRKGFCRS